MMTAGPGPSTSWMVGSPRRVGAWSIRSSWMRVALWMNSIAMAVLKTSSMRGWPRWAARMTSAGRIRLPPASRICCMASARGPMSARTTACRRRSKSSSSAWTGARKSVRVTLMRSPNPIVGSPLGQFLSSGGPIVAGRPWPAGGSGLWTVTLADRLARPDLLHQLEAHGLDRWKGVFEQDVGRFQELLGRPGDVDLVPGWLVAGGGQPVGGQHPGHPRSRGVGRVDDGHLSLGHLLDQGAQQRVMRAAED